jgi:hypothetical protein
MLSLIDQLARTSAAFSFFTHANITAALYPGGGSDDGGGGGGGGRLNVETAAAPRNGTSSTSTKLPAGGGERRPASQPPDVASLQRTYGGSAAGYLTHGGTKRARSQPTVHRVRCSPGPVPIGAATATPRRRDHLLVR